jgi:hypothetical protein
MVDKMTEQIEYSPAKQKGAYKGYSAIMMETIKKKHSRADDDDYVLIYKGIAKDRLDALLYVYKAFIRSNRFGTTILRLKTTHDTKGAALIEAEGKKGWHNFTLEGEAVQEEGSYKAEIVVSEYVMRY